MIVGKFKFNLTKEFIVEEYSCKDYFGVIFKTLDGRKYDVVCNPYFGDRLIINPGNNPGQWKDIPFKESTFSFLPEGIETSLVDI